MITKDSLIAGLMLSCVAWLGATVSIARNCSNLLLPNQARLERAAVTALQYHALGGARCELSNDRPHGGSFCLRVQAEGVAQAGQEFGVSTTTPSTREQVYYYEKKQYAVETTPLPPGPYTASVYVRGAKAINLTLSTDSGEKTTERFSLKGEPWQRIAVTLELQQPCTDLTLSFMTQLPTGFFIDDVLLETGRKDTRFNARPLPTRRPPIEGKGFLWRKGDRVICLGDSITDWAPGYVPVLRDRVKQKYPERGITIIRSGVGGNMFSALLARAPKDVVAREPDWVLINAGLNDVGHKVPLEQSRMNLESLVKLLLDTTTAQLVLVESSPFEGRPDLNPGVTAVNRVVSEVAKTNHLLVVPLEEAILKAKAAGEALYFSDPHFNTRGFTLMADTILKALHF